MSDLKIVLMERDDISAEEAEDIILELKESLNNYLNENDLESAYYVLEEQGLEPDYLMDLV